MRGSAIAFLVVEFEFTASYHTINKIFIALRFKIGRSNEGPLVAVGPDKSVIYSQLLEFVFLHLA